MKKLSIVFFGWALTLSAVCAQNTPTSTPNELTTTPTSTPTATEAIPTPTATTVPTLAPNQRWVEQIDGSFAVPSFGSQHEPDPGAGGDINIGYRFDRTFALFLGTGYYQYPVPSAPGGANAQLGYIPLVGILRASFGEGQIRPYIFEGIGFALNIFTQTYPAGGPSPNSSQSEIDFYMTPGVGISYAFASDMAAFVQSRLDLDYTSHNGLGLPLGNPSVFIPLQAGISFFAL
jgi:hypothetical protein